MKIFNPKAYGAKGDGINSDTKAIQSAIDAAAKEQGKVVLEKGIYLTSSLFLGSSMEFHMEKDAVLLGTTAEEEYPILDTRVAGIEMKWPVGILNINHRKNVKVTGEGIIDGQGPFWWNKYWGEDQKGGMRKIYDVKGLRWCVDYDCRRPRNLVVMDSENIELSGIESVRSGFWNIHLCYSKNIHASGLYIHDNDGPSTDGIDVDSCKHVVIEKCRIACNDDSICVKSGRDADGLRVGRVCEDVVIQNCEILTGCGVTIGSETSGGAKNITVRNLKYKNTDCGFRIKSAKTRGGVIENVLVENLQMTNVKYPFNMCLNWHPAYSYCRIPDHYEGEIPKHWYILASEVSEKQGTPKVQNITIRNVTSANEPGYQGISRAFEIDAFPEEPMENITFQQVSISAKEFGRIQGVKNIKWEEVDISVEGPNQECNNQFDVR